MRFAVVPATGIGDALIMLIASHHLRKQGHLVTTIHNKLPSFGRWLEKEHCSPWPKNDLDFLASFDAILLQHDNTARAKTIVSLRKASYPVFVFYPTYCAAKHGPLSSFDYAFNHAHTMVENCRLGAESLFGGCATAFNGLYPMPGLIHRKYPRRLLIHPMSADEHKNWPKHKFLELSRLLERMQFHPLFILSSTERQSWANDAIETPTLEQLATAIYESDYFIGNDSGPGHIASYLSIPHLIIGADAKNMHLWRPGWHQGEIICPPEWIPNPKGLRLRKNKWGFFISTSSVLKRFKLIIK